ncbi:hypothetical protein ACVWYF_000905 [Hymenobacter sp. UYAg731]
MPTFYKLFARPNALLLATALLAGPARAQTPAWQWGLQTQNPTPADGTVASGNAVTTDAAGRVYVGGSFGEDTNGTAVATRTLPGAGPLGPGRGGFVAQATAAGQWAWVAAVTSQGAASGGRARASVTSVAGTAAGDVYATGYVEGTGVQAGGLTHALSSGGQAIFVARFSSAGVCQWLQTADGFTTLPTVAFDSSTGGAVVAGTYQGSRSIGSTALPTGTSPNGEAVFVARLSPTGQWLGAAGATGSAGVISGLSMAVGPTGQVAIASSRGGGTLTFGATTLTTPATFDETYVVAQLNTANQWQWAVGGTTDYSRAIGVGYTAAGALWVAGRGLGGTVVGPLTLGGAGTPAASTYSGFLGQLSPTGQWGTAQQLTPSGPGLAVFAALAVDASGNAVALGALVGTNGQVQATLGGQTLTANSQRLQYFIAGLSIGGQLRYVAAVPSPTLYFGLTPAGIALDGNNGALYLTGTFTGGLTLGASQLMGSYNAAGGSTGGDALVGRLANSPALATRSATGAAALACFPNPAHSAATLRLPAALEAGTVALLDGLGRTVRTYALPAHSADITLDLRGLVPGLYGVRCGAASGRLVVE